MTSMWREITAYNREVRAVSTFEEAEPIYEAQLRCARRLSQAHPREFSLLMDRAARSTNPREVLLGLEFIVRCQLPDARGRIESTRHRLRTGEQRLQNFEPVDGARPTEGTSPALAEFLAGVDLLETELDS